MRRPLLALLSLLATWSAAPCQTCTPQGVTVAATGGRLGDAWRIDVQAHPLSLGVLGLDLSPGPIPTPLGTICLGLTPVLQLHTLLFDAAGAATFGGVMPVVPAYAGYQICAAAVSLDPSLPNGLGLSNGDSFFVRQPRFWFVDPGFASPFGSTPGAIAATNAVTDDVVFGQALTTTVRDATTVRERGWLVLLLGDGSLAAYDGSAPTPAWTASTTGAAAQATHVLAVPGGDALLLSTYGTAPSPFSSGVPGSVHVVSIPTGAIASSPLSAGNPDAMLLVPDTNLAVLRLANAIVPFRYDPLQLLPAVALPTGFGALADWSLGVGPLLYVLHGGQAASPFGGAVPGAISVVDVFGQGLLSTSPLGMAPPLQLLRAGPGSAGVSVYVYGATAATLDEFDQVSLTPIASLPIGSGITAMELSALGTQWLFLCSGGACGGTAVLGLDVGTTTIATLAGLAGTPVPALAVSPSLLFGKACTAVGSVATPLGSDPFAPATANPLPIAAATFRIVAD